MANPPQPLLKPSSVAKQSAPVIDAGNLLMIDLDDPPHTASERGVANGHQGKETMQQPKESDAREATLLSLARDNTQYLFNELWALPQHRVEEAICVELPASTYPLPREKPVPTPREPTKWERFAKERGIASKKEKKRRGGKVWDDATNEWRPRYGYRRAENAPTNKEWLIEIPDQKDPYNDYFAERANQRRERSDKQELQRLRNIRRSMGAAGKQGGGGGGMDEPPMGPPSFTPYVPPGGNSTKLAMVMGEKRAEKKAQSKADAKQMVRKVQRAKQATASLGTQEPAMKGEKRPKGGEGGRKRKFQPNFGQPAENGEESGGMGAEKKSQLAILERIASKKPKLVEAKFHAAAPSTSGGDGDGRRKQGQQGQKNRGQKKGGKGGGGRGKSEKRERNKQMKGRGKVPHKGKQPMKKRKSERS